jgi:hypothetical protein
MKTSGFYGSGAPAIASLRSSRLFVHSLLAGRGKSPPRLFPGMKTSGFHGSCAPAIASLRSSRLFVHSLLARDPEGRLMACGGMELLKKQSDNGENACQSVSRGVRVFREFFWQEQLTLGWGGGVECPS